MMLKICFDIHLQHIFIKMPSMSMINVARKVHRSIERNVYLLLDDTPNFLTIFL